MVFGGFSAAVGASGRVSGQLGGSGILLGRVAVVAGGRSMPATSMRSRGLRSARRGSPLGYAEGWGSGGAAAFELAAAPVSGSVGGGVVVRPRRRGRVVQVLFPGFVPGLGGGFGLGGCFGPAGGAGHGDAGRGGRQPPGMAVGWQKGRYSGRGSRVGSGQGRKLPAFRQPCAVDGVENRGWGRKWRCGDWD